MIGIEVSVGLEIGDAVGTTVVASLGCSDGETSSNVGAAVFSGVAMVVEGAVGILVAETGGEGDGVGVDAVVSLGFGVGVDDAESTIGIFVVGAVVSVKTVGI